MNWIERAFLEPRDPQWRVITLTGHRGPGKSWRLDAEGRPFLAPAWDGDGVPVYKPTATLVPPPLRLRVSFALVEAQASDWRYRLPGGRP